MFINYISTELKTNLKGSILNEDGSNLHQILVTPHNQDPEDAYVPDTTLLSELNVSIFYVIKHIKAFLKCCYNC